MRKQAEKKEAGKKDLVFGVLFGYLSTMIILLLLSLLTSKELFPESAEKGGIILASFLGSFVGGLAATRKLKGRGMPFALLTGAIMCFLNVIIRCFAPDGSIFAGFTLWLAAAFICGGLLSGAIRSKKRKKR